MKGIDKHQGLLRAGRCFQHGLRDDSRGTELTVRKGIVMRIKNRKRQSPPMLGTVHCVWPAKHRAWAVEWTDWGLWPDSVGDLEPPSVPSEDWSAVTGCIGGKTACCKPEESNVLGGFNGKFWVKRKTFLKLWNHQLGSVCLVLVHHTSLYLRATKEILAVFTQWLAKWMRMEGVLGVHTI